MTFTRSTPDVGYVDPATYRDANISQTVRAKDTVYFSGIVAATGPFETVAPGDMAGQVRFVLHILGRLLAEEALTFANLVSVTVYTPELETIQQHIGQFSERFAGNPPCVTMIGVKNLASPDYLLELVAIAVD